MADINKLFVSLLLEGNSFEKVSVFFKSFDGAEAFAMIRLIIDSAIKSNRNSLLITKLIAKCNGRTK